MTLHYKFTKFLFSNPEKKNPKCFYFFKATKEEECDLG